MLEIKYILIETLILLKMSKYFDRDLDLAQGVYVTPIHIARSC